MKRTAGMIILLLLSEFCIHAAGFVESIIQEYNDSQDRYSVKGRSVPDYQEIISDACQKAMIMEIGIGETLAEAEFKARSLY